MTWLWGNITGRSPASAIVFFGSFALFLLFWIGAIAVGYRRSQDPDKNYVEVTDAEIVVQRSWAGCKRIQRKDIESVALCSPRLWAGNIIGEPSPTVEIRLRRPSLVAYFGFGAIRAIQLAVVDPAGFLEHITADRA